MCVSLAARSARRGRKGGKKITGRERARIFNVTFGTRPRSPIVFRAITFLIGMLFLLLFVLLFHERYERGAASLFVINIYARGSFVKIIFLVFFHVLCAGAII